MKCGRVGLIYGESAGKFGWEFAGVLAMIQLPQGAANDTQPSDLAYVPQNKY
jgi:hypothetical protein